VIKAKRDQRHHYLPAAYIGRFSYGEQAKSRDRPVWVRRNGVARTFIESPSKLAFQIGLYNLPETDGWLGEHIDVWDYEHRLPGALTQLERHDEPLSAESWLAALVPFVAGQLVRGPDANDGSNSDARIIEFQELLAPVMAADWIVLHAPVGMDLITNDRGYGVVPLTNGGHAMVIPCSPRTAVALGYRDRRTILRWSDSGWTALLNHYNLSTSECSGIREAVAHRALRDVYGPTELSVGDVVGISSQVAAELPQFMVNPTVCDMDCHIYDYFRVCSAARSTVPAAQDSADQVLWKALPKDWSIPVAAEVLFPERTRGGVRVVGSELLLDLRFGIEVMRIRRELRDFRRGGYIVAPIKHLSEQGTVLGEQWRNGPAGDAGHTTMSINGVGAELAVDLSLLREDLGIL